MDPDLAIVMVAEDDAAFRGWLSAVLRNAGHEMVAAESAEGAIECMGRVTPDLVLMDVMLPGLSGFDLVAELRARDATANLPVIFISALGQRHFVRQGMELGADDFIAKPVSADEVIRSVETRLRRAGCAAATPPRAGAAATGLYVWWDYRETVLGGNERAQVFANLLAEHARQRMERAETVLVAVGALAAAAAAPAAVVRGAIDAQQGRQMMIRALVVAAAADGSPIASAGGAERELTAWSSRYGAPWPAAIHRLGARKRFARGASSGTLCQLKLSKYLNKYLYGYWSGIWAGCN